VAPPRRRLGPHQAPPPQAVRPEQAKALDVLLAGGSTAAAAEAAGVSRQTVSEWRNRDRVFREEFRARQEGVRRVADDALRGAATEEARAYRHARSATWSAIAHVSDVIRARARAEKENPDEAKFRPSDLEALVRSAAILRELEPEVAGEVVAPVLRAQDAEAARKVHDLLLEVARTAGDEPPALEVQARPVG